MISAAVRSAYRATIGIETHVQLKTRTKLFVGVGNDARQASPNTLVSHICFGLPGALPVLNREAVRLAVRAAFALGTAPAHFSKFDRKHYFYPDLPKGYQISQYDEPIIVSGKVDVVMVDEDTGKLQTHEVGITRAHLEEDAGKSMHPAGKDYSLVDLNRAGTPLLEIVSEPDMHSPLEAKAYVHELYLRMKYAEVSDCDLYLGHMRFDVNVSVNKDHAKLGTRTETKNLNSFRSVEKAAEYEINRQIELLERERVVVQETRGWDDAKQRTFTQRTKEEAHDYRYMPDPDLPPIVLEKAYVAEIQKGMPLLPNDYRAKFSDLQIEPTVIEDILGQPYVSQLLLRCINKSKPEDGRRIAFWLLRLASEERGGETNLAKADENELIALSHLVDEGTLSSSAAKEVAEELLSHGGSAKNIAENKNLLQMSDEATLMHLVKQVLEANPTAMQDIKKGEMKAIGFLVGQVMKLSHGTANPSLTQKLIKKNLGSSDS